MSACAIRTGCHEPKCFAVCEGPFLVVIQSFFNPVRHKPEFKRPWSGELLKTLLEKEKMLSEKKNHRFQIEQGQNFVVW